MKNLVFAALAAATALAPTSVAAQERRDMRGDMLRFSRRDPIQQRRDVPERGSAAPTQAVPERDNRDAYRHIQHGTPPLGQDRDRWNGHRQDWRSQDRRANGITTPVFRGADTTYRHLGDNRDAGLAPGWSGDRHAAEPDHRRGDHRDWRQDDRGDRPDRHHERGDDHREWRSHRDGGVRVWHRDGNDRRDWRGSRGANRWDGDWRRDHRYDWRDYRARNRYAYRLPRYYAPRSYGYGYGYRRFSVGFTLGSPLFASNYWIDDPWEYRLPPADGRYRWVRYYNDALLVDIETGEVIDTVYDIFW